MSNADRRFEEGLEYFRQANYEAALRIWKALEDEGFLHPNLGLYVWAAQTEYGRMLHSVGEFAERLGPTVAVEPQPDLEAQARSALDGRRYREALGLLRQVIAQAQEAVRPRLMAVQAALRCGLLSDALELARDCLALAPSDAEARVAMGQVLAELDRPLDSAKAYRAALALSDRTSAAWIGLAELALRDRWLAEAERFVDRALSCLPAGSPVKPFGDEIRRERRRAEAGLEECRRILAQNPSYPDWHYRRGALAASLGLEDEATAALDRALELNPRMPRAWQQKALLLEHAGQTRAACAALRQALELTDEADLARCRQADALEEAGRHEEAFQTLLRVLRLSPDYASRHVETGKKFFAGGLHDEAERELTRGVSLAPQYADGHYYLGLIALSRKQASEAIGRFKTALSLNPRYSEAALRLVEAFLADGNFEGARPTLEQWRGQLESAPGFAAAFQSLEKRIRDEAPSKKKNVPRRTRQARAGGARKPRQGPSKTKKRSRG